MEVLCAVVLYLNIKGGGKQPEYRHLPVLLWPCGRNRIDIIFKDWRWNIVKASGQQTHAVDITIGIDKKKRGIFISYFFSYCGEIFPTTIGCFIFRRSASIIHNSL